MGEHRAWPACEHGSHAVPVAGQELTRDEGVHTAVNSVEAPRARTLADRVGRNAKLPQLIEREDTMLDDPERVERLVHGSPALALVHGSLGEKRAK